MCLYWETTLLLEEGINALGCRSMGKLIGKGALDNGSGVLLACSGSVAKERGRQGGGKGRGEIPGNFWSSAGFFLKIRRSGDARLT